MDAQPSQLEALRIFTRCTNRDQFVAKFRRLCTPTSCFIPTRNTRPIGTATVFSFRLADGSRLLEGEGVVLEAWTTNQNRFKRPGVHLGIHRLSDETAAFYKQLLDIAAELETPTVEMPPLPLPDEPRTPGSELVLPANPLTDMTDDLVAEFIDCNLTAGDVVPVEPSVIIDLPDAHPRAAHDTIPNPLGSRDVVGTLLGMVPLTPPRIYAAPTPVITELVDRVRIQVPATPRPSAPRLAVSRERPVWISATVAATLAAVALWFTLTNL